MEQSKKGTASKTAVPIPVKYGSGSVLVGRLDFKSSMRRSDPAVGEFDSHTLPPNKARFYRQSSKWGCRFSFLI